MSDTLKIAIYLLIMGGITYLTRAMPLIAFRRKIKSRFMINILYYLPYTVLSAMIIPDVLWSTGNIITAAAGFAVALILAFFNKSLIKVALMASLAAFVTGVIFSL